MGSLIALLILGAIVWFWLDSSKSRELASQHAFLACQQANIQFLDQTVSLEKILPARNKNGMLILKRIYGFDFSLEGEMRLHGRVIMKAHRIQQIQMDLPEGIVIENREPDSSDT